ncbi:hypothetical protein N7512_010534 [Penicillium capsulatum]|nr:hypothetical protein N7512_010534 [Penicillium capsulatum]
MVSDDQPDNLAYPHFALIYIDRDGNLRQEASQSIAQSRETILSPRVRDAFLRAVAMSNTGPVSPQFESGAPTPRHERSTGPRPLAPQTTPIPPVESQRLAPTSTAPPIQMPTWTSQDPPPHWGKPSPQRRNPSCNEELSRAVHQTAYISVRDKEMLRHYYEKVFQNLQQTNCRVLAKAYIKLVEPRKQVNYPYNGRKIVAGQTRQLDPDETKPPWWPSGVSHREPDHLPKAERIRLLVHLLCELRTSHGITARRLKDADQPIRRQISPPERVQILDEMYEVRAKEESFLQEPTDGKALVSISRANLPDAVEASLGRGEKSQRPSPEQTSPIPEPDVPTDLSSGSAPGMNVSQPVLTTVGDLSVHTSPIIHSTTHSPPQYLNTDLPIHTSFDATGGSIPPQDMKRKRQCVEPGPPTTTATTPLDYYSPMFVGSQPLVAGGFHSMQGYPANTSLPAGQVGAEAYDGSMFPYYFGF